MVAAIAQSTALVPAPKMQLIRPIADLAEIVEAKKQMLDLIPKALTKDVDFGTIPGTNKECLFKAGAERMCQLFGAHPEYEIVEKEIDHDRKNVFKSQWVDSGSDKPANWQELKAKGVGRNKNKGTKDNPEWVWQERGEGMGESFGLYRFVIRCRIVRQDGLVLAESLGSCSTLEGKYIDRPRDCENTVLKMGQKRAFVGAALNAFGLSDRFTADVDDVAGEVHGKPANDAGVVDAEFEEGETRGKPATSKAAEKVRTAINEAHDAAKAADDEAKRKAGASALSWAKAFLDKLDKATDVPKDAGDDVKKGALEAFNTVLDENEAPLKALATQAEKLHFAVTTYAAVLANHMHGVEAPIEGRERAALDWLHQQRGPKEPTTSA